MFVLGSCCCLCVVMYGLLCAYCLFCVGLCVVCVGSVVSCGFMFGWFGLLRVVCCVCIGVAVVCVPVCCVGVVWFVVGLLWVALWYCVLCVCRVSLVGGFVLCLMCVSRLCCVVIVCVLSGYLLGMLVWRVLSWFDAF